MPESHSRADKRVERISVTDEPHEKYRDFDPWTGKQLAHGMPVLTSTPHGKVMDKDVTHKVVRCPECDIPARYTHDSEPVCPTCGIICSGSDVILDERIVRDAKAAGRIDGGDEKTTA